jgi:putative hemolysin
LQEIGRLREITFRATNEGTGKARDLDRFDNWYTHLFVWHKTRGEIVGAYRLGITDEIVAERGTAGLYTSTLFKYRAGLVERMGPAIELGRSFIRLEYQRSYAALLLLWKGIGRIVVERPQCKALFGPVSISNDYQTSSKHLMVQFLAASHYVPDLAELTRPRHPFRPPGMKKLTAQGRLNRLLSDSDAVDDVVAELEPDGKGMPVLLRQYLKLGARFFAFNVDPDFSDALDALMLVDLTKTDRKLLQRYMGEEGMGSFLRWHKVG